MKKVIFLVIVTMVFASCGPRKPSVAELREEKRRQDSISLRQYEQTVVYTDSLLQTLLPEADKMLKGFKYVKNEKYEDHGYYISKHLQTAGLGQRIFLQAYVTDDFKTVVRSMYYGARMLSHDCVIVSADGVENKFNGNLHSFEEDGFHEIVTLNDADGVQLLKFVNAYSTYKIKVTLVGKINYVYTLPDKDVQALIETLRLQTIMADIRSLEEQSKQASMQVDKYRRRLEK